MNYLKFISILFLIQNLYSKTIDPVDLKIYSQKANSYTKNIAKLDMSLQKKLYDEFMFAYFSPWRLNKLSISKKDITWGKVYFKSEVYGENYRLVSKKWLTNILIKANMNKYDSIRRYAITVRNSSLRLFPSLKPLFKHYKDAGEGFPFDYGQNSSIYLNTPLYISHYSNDRAWAFVSSHFASGWIQTQDIATVSSEVIEKFKKNNKYFVAIKDNFPIYKSGVFKDYVKLGTIFPIRKEKFAVVIRDNTGKGYISRIDRNKNIVNFPIKFNKKNVNNIINELINKPYGWGGSLGNRDCSLLTKDTLTPFGFPMKRNSSAQIKNGKYISFKYKTNQQKIDYIKKHAIAFLSLIYIKGHIALYIGQKNNVPLIFHSLWGVKTLVNKKDSRHIVGKTVISSLEIGKEIKGFDNKRSVLSLTKGLVILIK